MSNFSRAEYIYAYKTDITNRTRIEELDLNQRVYQNRFTVCCLRPLDNLQLL